MIREPFTPAEFDAEMRRFEGDNPTASLTSGARSPEHNREVGGTESSKHLLGMARDYKIPDQEERDAAQGWATRHGLWWKPYPWGIHMQGLPPGEIPRWWLDKYGGMV